MLRRKLVLILVLGMAMTLVLSAIPPVGAEPDRPKDLGKPKPKNKERTEYTLTLCLCGNEKCKNDDAKWKPSGYMKVYSIEDHPKGIVEIGPPGDPPHFDVTAVAEGTTTIMIVVGVSGGQTSIIHIIVTVVTDCPCPGGN